ncbi:MAG: alpha/beta fold hydrolase [Bacteroidota bacterium]
MRPNLFLIHFAGGNRYSFNFLKPHLKEAFNFIPLELPGRGQRMAEKYCSSIEKAVDDLLQQVVQTNGSNPFVIYGHSLGSTLALLLAHKLELMNRPPLGLIVSGNPGPGVEAEKDYKSFYKLSDEAFIEELKIMGGLPDEILTNEELLAFFLPILRADFSLYAFAEPDFNPIQTPIYAIMGDEEDGVDQIENWERFTTAKFNYSVMQGKHFFIFDFPQKIALIIKESLKRVS